MTLYTRRGYRFELGCEANKADIFRSLEGVTVVDRGAHRHPWPLPDILDADPESDREINKISKSLSKPPLPDIGRSAKLWDELTKIKLNLDPVVSKDVREAVDRFLDPLPRPVIALHTHGNTGGPNVRLDETQCWDLYTGLLDRTEGSLLLLDWDNRIPRLAHARVRHLTDDCRRINTAELYYLLTRVDLLIGIDSGPLFLAGMTDTLALGVWKGGHPARATLPRDRTLHLTAPRFRPKNRPRRIQWNIVESPEDPIRGDFVAEQAARLLSPPRYLPADRIVQDVQLQQFVEWTRGGRMHPDNSWADRHRSFDLALRDLAALDHPPVVVETGAMRAPEDWAGAGMSTYLFGAFLHNVGGTLHSVEINPQTARFAQQETACFGHTVKIHYRPSNVWLPTCPQQVDLFYADSVDVGHPCCGRVCLDEVYAIQDKLRDRTSKILIDDTWYSRSGWRGKGEKAVPWLLQQGWEVIHSGHQTYLGRK